MSSIHPVVNENVHPEKVYTCKTFNYTEMMHAKYEMLENILQLCGFDSFTDYKTQVSLKDIKKTNAKNNTIGKINEILLKNNVPVIGSIDELFTFVRNYLTNLCIPYEMVHKKYGNYLALVESKYNLANYLEHKQDKTLSKKLAMYKDYNDLISKNEIVRSIGDSAILLDLVKSKKAGVIKKKIVKNTIDNATIIKSGKKYYARYALSDLSVCSDIIKNISFWIAKDGIIIDTINHVTTCGSFIIDKKQDVIVLQKYIENCINVELTKDMCDDILSRTFDKEIYAELDEIVLESQPRTALTQIQKYDASNNIDNFYGSTNTFNVDLIIDCKNSKYQFVCGTYSNIHFVDNNDQILDKPVIINYCDEKCETKTYEMKKGDVLITFFYSANIVISSGCFLKFDRLPDKFEKGYNSIMIQTKKTCTTLAKGNIKLNY